MEVFLAFIIAFFFSFVGTIPPGTLNLTILQLGLAGRVNVAWRMSIAAAFIEYFYAWIAVEFQEVVTASIEITRGFHLVAGFVMILLGGLNLASAARPSRFSERFQASGFRKGLLVSLLNPLAIPFWMAMTAYLKSYGFVELSGAWELHAYLLGVSSGTVVLCMLLAYLARRVVSHFKTSKALQIMPGVVLILLGLHAFVAYMLA